MRAELRGVISTKPGLNRQLRVTPGGLARIAENTCGATWPELRHELDRIAVGTFAGPAGTFRQRTGISDAQAAILAQLNIGPPPRSASSPQPQPADQQKHPA
jgi:hypothetical protein